MDENKDNLDLQTSSNQEILDYFNEHNNAEADVKSATNGAEALTDKQQDEGEKYEVKMTKEEYDRFINLNKIENIKDPVLVSAKGVESDPVLENAIKLMNTQRKPLLVPLDKIKVTEDEKESYLRCVLDDKLVWSTTIKIAGKEFNVKAKTVADQEFIVNKLQEFATKIKEDAVSTHTDLELATLLLKLNIMLSITNIDLLPVKPNVDPEDVVNKNVEENLNKLSQISTMRMNIYVNVMRIFEEKEQILGYEIISGDF